ncbi:P-selectin-like [Protopterus annectens]|uniref:P-selectin-like n=1 Tax=Protopterus annectens TaxID=7888 RepID=UPI001CF9CBCD|nr:P-selectin-like [Protopterus annectens]
MIIHWCKQHFQQRFTKMLHISVFSAVICPQPEVKDGQKVNESGRGSQFNTSFTFECNEGFTLRGSSVVTCNKDGHWDPPLPKCEVVMCPKLVVQNGQKVNVTGPENQVNTSVTIKCNKGFILRGTSVVTCNKHGRWDPPLPTCEEIVCAVPQITDGLRIMVSDQHNRFGSSWTFRCDKGFTMNGSPTVTCGEKGVWIPSRPTCQRLKCKDPQITEGLKITKLNRENVVGSSVTFKCENGFTMNGRNTVTCNEEGVWDPSPPTCQHASHTPWSLILTVFAVIVLILFCCGGFQIFYKKYHQGRTYNIKDSKVSPEPYMSSGGYSMSSTKYRKFGEAQPNKYCATNASYYLNEKSVPLGTVSYISVLPVAFGQSCHLPDAGLNTHAYHENKQKILYIPSAGNIVKPVTQYKAQNT